MFMTPDEIKSRFSMARGDRSRAAAEVEQIHAESLHSGRNFQANPVTDEEAWLVKKRDAKASGLVDSVKQRGGVEIPPTVGFTPKGRATIFDGHTRIAAHAEALRQGAPGVSPLMPVNYSESGMIYGLESQYAYDRNTKELIRGGRATTGIAGEFAPKYNPNNPYHKLV